MSEVRLIDADALKKAFEDTVCIEPMPYAFVKQIIDNAPTISPYKAIHDELHKGEEHISEVKKNETDN